MSEPPFCIVSQLPAFHHSGSPGRGKPLGAMFGGGARGGLLAVHLQLRANCAFQARLSARAILCDVVQPGRG